MTYQSPKSSNFKTKLQFYRYFLPLKRNAILFLIAVITAALLIRSEFYAEESFFNPYIELFAWVFGVFILLVVGLGLIYTLVCRAHLMLNFSTIRPDIKIGLEDGQKGEVGKIGVQLSLSHVMMPLIGYLKMRVVFEEGDITAPIILNKFVGGWKDLKPKEGSSNLWLNERRQYNIKGFLISFEDYLQFFRLTAFKPTNKSFYLYPPQSEIDTEDIKPSKSQEMVEKIKTSKRVEGDYLNYKDFESGDDVRRIVWKIFAKNKELVVRVPETINPYASHIYFFSSFYNTQQTDFGSLYTKGMLNYYKDIIYNVCLSLQKTGRQVKFNIDQTINDAISVEKADEMKYKLSCANWQKDTSASDIQVPASEAVLCVSSLIPASELEELINKRPVSLFIVRTSKYLDHMNLFNWKNLFLRAEGKNELSKLSWLLSSARRRIVKNEKRISELISNNDFEGQII